MNEVLGKAFLLFHPLSKNLVPQKRDMRSDSALRLVAEIVKALPHGQWWSLLTRVRSPARALQVLTATSRELTCLWFERWKGEGHLK